MNIYHSLKEAFPGAPEAAFVAQQLLPAFRDKLQANDGGMKALGAISLIQCLMLVKPSIYVELGAWKGLSTLIARHFLPNVTEVFAFDPNPHLFSEKVEGVSFSDQDWAKPAYMVLNAGCGGFLFADDHQDVVERLVTAWLRGYDFVLFDDDYAERADHRTFRNFILQKANADATVAGIMDLCIEKLVLLSKPDFNLNDNLNPHWRDQVFVQLKKPMDKGWTMGNPSFFKLQK